MVFCLNSSHRRDLIFYFFFKLYWWGGGDLGQGDGYHALTPQDLKERRLYIDYEANSDNKRCGRMCGIKISAVGECAE